MRRKPYHKALIEILCLRENNLNPLEQRGVQILHSTRLSHSGSSVSFRAQRRVIKIRRVD